jgi:AmiR/NasT family two-component response regulator
MDKLRILIVEDEPIISNDIKASLAKLGYEVCGWVASGASAVKSAEDLRPDLILMDIILQGDMNGIEAANIINKRFNIPIIYMTGNADMETIQSARDTNPYGYVLKPVNSMNLFSVIDTALRRHNLEKDLRDSEEKFRIISENIIDGLALTIDAPIW